MDGSGSRDLSYKRREFEREKQKHSPFLNAGALVADDQLLAFDIQKPLGGFIEWHLITFNQIRILEELREVKKQFEGFKRPSPAAPNPPNPCPPYYPIYPCYNVGSEGPGVLKIKEHDQDQDELQRKDY